MNIIERLLEDAIHHDDISTQCDCAPEHTVNYDHAINAREAAKEIQCWRDRFPAYEYRVQDECIALKLTPNV